MYIYVDHKDLTAENEVKNESGEKIDSFNQFSKSLQQTMQELQTLQHLIKEKINAAGEMVSSSSAHSPPQSDSDQNVPHPNEKDPRSTLSSPELIREDFHPLDDLTHDHSEDNEGSSTEIESQQQHFFRPFALSPVNGPSEPIVSSETAKNFVDSFPASGETELTADVDPHLLDLSSSLIEPNSVQLDVTPVQDDNVRSKPEYHTQAPVDKTSSTSYVDVCISPMPFY
jgi:hypothetical protein